MKRVSFVSALIAGFFLFTAQVISVQAVPVQQRIRQGVVINGQQAEGVTVIQNGQVQSFTCSAPQPYTTLDNSSSGWACLDQSNGTWLLNAVPPQQAEGVYEQPPAYYPDDNYYYSDAYPDYPYGYYPYGYYPYNSWGPAFSFGFGFGGHGHDYYEHGHHEYYGHSGGHERGSAGHGGGHAGGHVEGSHGGGGGHGGGGHGGGGHGGGGHDGGGHH